MISKFKAWMARRIAAPATSRGVVYVPAMTKAGVRITPDTALTVSGFWSGIRAITDPTSVLSWHVFERVGDGKERRENHPVDWLISRAPNEEMNAGTWRETMLSNALAFGNGVSEIERSGSGQPMALWPLAPDRVQPDRTSSGRLFYDVWNETGPNTALQPRDVFHLKGLGDGIWGLSVVTLAAQALGLNLAMETYSASYFGNGQQPAGVLEHPQKLTEQAKTETLKHWALRHQGPARSHLPALLDGGVKYSATSLPNDVSQLIESRKLGITEIARWLRVQPHKLMDLENAHLANIEEQNIEFVQDCLLFWTNKLEQEADTKLFGYGSQGRLFTKLNLKTLLRGNTAAQTEHVTAMLGCGVYDVDEARDYLDMNPLGGKDGKKRFVPLNMQLLEKAGEEPEPPPAPEPVVVTAEENGEVAADEPADTESPVEPVNRLNGHAVSV